MIQFCKAYTTTDGKTFGVIEEAQQHELELMFGRDTPATASALAAALLQNADKIVDILTTTKSSKPKARRINGGTKVRKSIIPLPGLQSTVPKE